MSDEAGAPGGKEGRVSRSPGWCVILLLCAHLSHYFVDPFFLDFATVSLNCVELSLLSVPGTEVIWLQAGFC